jgi:hypothetical protein
MGDKATPSQTKLKSATTTIITHMDENKTWQKLQPRESKAQPRQTHRVKSLRY